MNFKFRDAIFLKEGISIILSLKICLKDFIFLDIKYFYHETKSIP
jgi:hypothetical protein